MDKIPKCQIPKPVRNDSRVFAFTLAEVLITLVIIGVVAALTIPNLLQKYQEQATVKKLQKFYSTLSNAYALAMKENGPVSEWNITRYDADSSAKIYEILFKPYFKITKNCGVNNTGNCISTVPYKKLNNGSWTSYSGGAYYKVLLDDGSAIWFVGSGLGSNNNAVDVIYDINGHKNPNQWGRDTFNFIAYNKTVYPSGAQGYHGINAFKTHCNKSNDGMYCAAWVVYKGNMDYLHCDGLTWNSRSCKEK